MSSSPRSRLAFPELFRVHAPFVWRVLRRYGVAEADLEDVCQDVFMVVHRRLDEFEGRSHVRTWIYEIARRTALKQRRRTAAREIPLATVREEADGQVDPDRKLEQKRVLAWLEAALCSLSEEKREAFVLYELEEMTLCQVAEALGCAVNTAHYRVSTAREELRVYGRRGELRTRLTGRPSAQQRLS